MVTASAGFGESMCLEQVQAAFSGNGNESVRAFGQMLCCFWEECIIAATNSNGTPHDVSFQLGAGNAIAELTRIMTELAQGKIGGTLAEWFPESTKAE